MDVVVRQPLLGDGLHGFGLEIFLDFSRGRGWTC